jgi:hypothetical protein
MKLWTPCVFCLTAYNSKLTNIKTKDFTDERIASIFFLQLIVNDKLNLKCTYLHLFYIVVTNSWFSLPRVGNGHFTPAKHEVIYKNTLEQHNVEYIRYFLFGICHWGEINLFLWIQYKWIQLLIGNNFRTNTSFTLLHLTDNKVPNPLWSVEHQMIQLITGLVGNIHHEQLI